MTGKADAVRAVSQQFKDRTNTVIEGVMAHLREDNAKEILGPGLSPLIGRGSLKSIVTFALYADVLRMVRDMVMADGEISDEEVQESLGLLSVLAAGFAKVRSKEYAAFTQLTPETARQFLSQYESDAGLFGHANESTKWTGVTLCSSVQTLCHDPAPITELRGLLMAWAQSIAETHGTAGNEQEVLSSLHSLFHTHPFAEEATESNDNDDEGDDEESVDREERPKMKKRNTTSTFRCGVCKTAFTIEYDRADMDRWKKGKGDLEESLSYLTDDERELILSGTCGKCFDDGHFSDGADTHDEPHTLTEMIAKAFREDPSAVDTKVFTHITDAAARLLAEHEGALFLNGLVELSEGAASAIAANKFYLELSGLTSLSRNLAELLADSNASLCLDGLGTLDSDIAKALARHQGRLSLNGVTELSGDEAVSLSQHKGGLVLDGFATVPDHLFRLLTQHGEYVCFGGITHISESMASSLVDTANLIGEDLYLDGLRSLSVDVAELLVQHKGGLLSFGGLRTLPAEVAKVLSRHSGGLGLEGLDSISEEAAFHLGSYAGNSICLYGVRFLSSAAAESLRAYRGELDLDWDSVILLPEFTSMKEIKTHFSSLDSLLERPDDDSDDDSDDEWDEEEDEDD